MITFKTNYGDIKIELDFDNTPNTAANFLRYAEEGFFTNTIFHRVISGFMIQGGGFEPGMNQKQNHEPIKNEGATGGKNLRGTLSMARTNDPHSATSQFFINHKNNAFLDFRSETVEGYGYCVFGRVVEGMDIVDKIADVPTTSRAGHQDVPVEDIVIKQTLVEMVAA